MQQNIIDIIKQARCLIDILLKISPKKYNSIPKQHWNQCIQFHWEKFRKQNCRKKTFIFVQIFSAGKKLPFIFKSTTIISPFFLDTACHQF